MLSNNMMAEFSDLAAFVSRDIKDILPSKFADLKKSLSVSKSWIPQITTELDLHLAIGENNKTKDNPCNTNKTPTATTNATKKPGLNTSHAHFRRGPGGLKSKLNPNLHLKATLKCTFNHKTQTTQTKKAVKHATNKVRRVIQWGKLFVRETLELLGDEA
jgi:hypothetical protein